MLIVYSGSDAYRLSRATADTLLSYRDQYGSTANFFFIDGSAEDAAEHIERPLKYASFFDEKKIVVIRNAAGEAMAGILKDYTVSTMDDLICIAIQQTTHDSCDKKVLTALIKAADRAESFEPLTGASLATWVRGYCSERATTIETTALTALLQRAGGDTQLLSNELEKLCAYAHGGTISLQDVYALIPVRYEQDEWELSNALAAHDKRAAIAVLWRRLQQGTPEQLLLASLAAGIRNLSMVKDMQSRRQLSGAIATATGLHPFVVSKTMRGATAADATKLRSAHIGLAQLDRAAKEGLADTVDGLFAVVLGL